jgi:hypothetical protein
LSLEAPALVDELDVVPALEPAVEAAVAPTDPAVEVAAAAPAEVEPAEAELAEAELAEEPGCAAIAWVSACRRLEKRSTPNEDWPAPESRREESPDFPGLMCGGVKPTR